MASRYASRISTSSSGVGAEIGFQQRAGDVERRARLHGQRQIGQRVGHLFQVPVVEASRHVGRGGEEDALQRVRARRILDAHVVARQPRVAAVEADQPRDVIGHPGLAQVGEHREVVRRAGVEAAAQPHLAGPAKQVDRTAQVRFALILAAPAGKFAGRQPIGAPRVAACAMPGVQRSHQHVESARRNPGFHHAPAEPVDLLFERQAAQPPVDEPFGEAGQVERRWSDRHECAVQAVDSSSMATMLAPS